MVDLQKIVDKWLIDKGSSVMLPWLGSITCGEAAIAIADALRQIAELRAERDRARHHTSELLARIHRDGGHYEAEHGTSKAVTDADAIVANLAAAKAENARLRALPLKDEVERVLERLANSSQALLNHFNACDLPEDQSQQWQSVEKQIDNARALLSRLRAGEQEGWRSMDSAPKNWSDVLLYLPESGIAVVIGYYDKSKGWVSRGLLGTLAPTHWMPLPAAPKQGEAQEVVGLDEYEGTITDPVERHVAGRRSRL